MKRANYDKRWIVWGFGFFYMCYTPALMSMIKNHVFNEETEIYLQWGYERIILSYGFTEKIFPCNSARDWQITDFFFLPVLWQKQSHLSERNFSKESPAARQYPRSLAKLRRRWRIVLCQSQELPRYLLTCIFVESFSLTDNNHLAIDTPILPPQYLPK